MAGSKKESSFIDGVLIYIFFKICMKSQLPFFLQHTVHNCRGIFWLVTTFWSQDFQFQSSFEIYYCRSIAFEWDFIQILKKAWIKHHQWMITPFLSQLQAVDFKWFLFSGVDSWGRSKLEFQEIYSLPFITSTLK